MKFPISNEHDFIKKDGRTYENPKRALSYVDVKFDEYKWADASKFLPGDYDLCHCKTKDKTISGWHTGIAWDGLKIKPDDEILYWKLNYDT